MKRNLFLAVALLCLCGTKSIAQSTASVPSEKKESVAASDEDIAKLIAAVEANPNDLAAHKAYLKTFGKEVDKAKFQYDKWIKKYPKSVNTVFAIGQAYYNQERPEATPYLKKVVAMDPKKAEVYEMLAIDACRWGDYPANARYEKMAWEAEPDNYTYARHYALALLGRDNGEWKQLCRQVEKHFAGKDEAAQALGLIGVFSDDPKEKEAIFLEQMQKYPVEKFPGSKNGMSWLAQLYIASNPAKSIDLYKKVIALDTGANSMASYYKGSMTFAETILTGQEMMKAGRYEDAILKFASYTPARYSNLDAIIKLELLRAEALDAVGKTNVAYDSLLKRVSTKPNDLLLSALNEYGKKLGKTPAQIADERWHILTANAKPATDFNLYAYLEKKNISLKDYRGKTLFLSFWFPGCGPCRSEMKHLEPVVRKFSNKDFAYVGINGFPEQDPYVESFVKKTGFSFTPLRDDGKTTKDYGVRGYPTNFIIDASGNIVYSGFMISTSDDERMLELIIQSVVDHNSN